MVKQEDFRGRSGYLATTSNTTLSDSHVRVWILNNSSAPIEIYLKDPTLLFFPRKGLTRLLCNIGTGDISIAETSSSGILANILTNQCVTAYYGTDGTNNKWYVGAVKSLGRPGNSLAVTNINMDFMDTTNFNWMDSINSEWMAQI